MKRKLQGVVALENDVRSLNETVMTLTEDAATTDGVIQRLSNDNHLNNKMANLFKRKTIDTYKVVAVEVMQIATNINTDTRKNTSRLFSLLRDSAFHELQKFAGACRMRVVDFVRYADRLLNDRNRICHFQVSIKTTAKAAQEEIEEFFMEELQRGEEEITRLYAIICRGATAGVSGDVQGRAVNGGEMRTL